MKKTCEFLWGHLDLQMKGYIFYTCREVQIVFFSFPLGESPKMS